MGRLSENMQTSHRKRPGGWESNQRLERTNAASANQISTALCHNVLSFTTVTEIEKGKIINQNDKR